MLTATSAETQLGATAADGKPQANVLHQLNLQANAVRRTIGHSGSAVRAEPLRLVRRVIGQG